MKRVAKVLISDSNDRYLLLTRSDHPRFPGDPDLPGGTVEDDEDVRTAAIREVFEEVGVSLDKSKAMSELYAGIDHSAYGQEFHLYEAKVTEPIEVKLSWEHNSYEWVSYEQLLIDCQRALDTYMNMVASVTKGR